MAGGYTHAALATRTTEFYGNRIFDAAAIAAIRPSLEPMATPWLQVHAITREHSLQLMTADRVCDEGIDPRNVLLVAYDWTPDAERLVAQGARPAVLVSFEPPVIAWWLYYHLQQVSALSAHVAIRRRSRACIADNPLPPAVVPATLASTTGDGQSLVEAPLSGHD